MNKINRFGITALAFLLCNLASAQDKILPAELEPFRIPGHEMLDFVSGDLNGDKKPDVILILKRTGEDTLLEDDYPRPLLLLVRQTNGRLKQVLRNDKAILCRRCGGVFGDPYQQTDISNNGFSLYFYGGSAWRWAYQFDFAWRPAKNNWMLVRESRGGFNANDPEMKMKETTIKETELGNIPISSFNAEPAYEDSRWKVAAAKTWFYDNPEMGSKPRKAYLVKGNSVTGIRHLKNFIEVSFENSQSVITQGYILRKDLQQLK